MALNINLKIITSSKKIGADILKHWVRHLKTRIPPLSRPLTHVTRNLLDSHIKASPEYEALNGGVLQQELGVVDPRTALDQMLSVLISTINVTPRPIHHRSGQIFGGFRLTAVPINFHQQLDGIGVYGTDKGEDIPWLKWLLTLGDSPIIKDYKVIFNNSKASRVGGAVMGKGGSWGVGVSSSRIRPEYSGTPDNNFVTRAITMMSPELERIMTDLIRRKV
jgi:hypothetical protein